jgi:hypothetical protein
MCRQVVKPARVPRSFILPYLIRAPMAIALIRSAPSSPPAFCATVEHFGKQTNGRCLVQGPVIEAYLRAQLERRHMLGSEVIGKAQASIACSQNDATTTSFSHRQDNALVPTCDSTIGTQTTSHCPLDCSIACPTLSASRARSSHHSRQRSRHRTALGPAEGVPSSHIRCRMTAGLHIAATRAQALAGPSAQSQESIASTLQQLPSAMRASLERIRTAAAGRASPAANGLSNSSETPEASEIHRLQRCVVRRNARHLRHFPVRLRLTTRQYAGAGLRRNADGG